MSEEYNDVYDIDDSSLIPNHMIKVQLSPATFLDKCPSRITIPDDVKKYTEPD